MDVVLTSFWRSRGRSVILYYFVVRSSREVLGRSVVKECCGEVLW